MNRNFLLINLDELELAKKLNFNSFLREYIALRNYFEHLSCQCSSPRKLKRKKHNCKPNEETRIRNRDLFINSILSNRCVNLQEKDLKILQDMVENRWELLKKIEFPFNI